MTDAEKAAADKAAADKAAADKAEADKAAADKAEADRKAAEGDKGGKPTDAEAKLLKEVMAGKEKLKAAEQAAKDAADKLKAFEGIDATEVRALVDAKKKADAEAKKAEEEALAKKGEWDRLKSQMVDLHTKELEKERTEKATVVSQNTTLQQQIADLTVGGAFGSSSFVKDELALTPTKARVIYGPHFEFQNGKVVAFDKPAGVKDRTMLVDSKGEPLGFEDAFKKIVDADPEKDHMLRAKGKTGAGSTTTPGARKVGDGQPELKGSSKIAAGLAALKSSQK